LAPKTEEDIYKIIGEKTKLIGIDHFVGTYDIHIFAFIKNIEDLQEIKQLIRKQKGVYDVDIFLWNRIYVQFNNFQLENLGDKNRG